MSDEELADLDEDAKEALKAGELPEFDDNGEQVEAKPGPGYRPKNGDYVNVNDDDWYTKAVKKKIDKHHRRAKDAEDQLAEERAERARLQAEVEASRKRLSQYEDEQDEGLKGRIDDLKSRRDKALDDGELSEYARLNDELTEAKIEQRDRVHRRSAKPAAQDDDDHGGRGRQQATPKASGAAQSWGQKHLAWLQQDEANLSLAKSIEAKLARKYRGYDDPEMYRELSKRLAAASDDFVDDEGGFDDEVIDDDPPPRQGGASSGVPRNPGSHDAGSRGSDRLTRNDLSSMAKFGLDPNSPKDRLAWKSRNAEL